MLKFCKIHRYSGRDACLVNKKTNPRVRSGFRQVLSQSSVQPLTVAAGDLKDPLVPDHVEHLASAVDQHRASVAAAKVLLDGSTQARIQIVIDVVGQLLQNSVATHHGFFPLKNGSRSIHRFPKTGARCSLI